MKVAKELSALKKDSSPIEIISKVNEIVAEHNFFIKNFSMSANSNGQILENIVFLAGETKTIPHGLAIQPKYRIIMRQVGNGVLDDIPSAWTKNSIQMKNNGAVTVTATIFLVRE